MIYVDPLLVCLKSKKFPFSHSCHMIADTEEELIRFAISISLKREWIQRGRIPHYDITQNKRKIAIMKGAVEIDMHTFVAKLHEWEEREDDGTV